MNYNYHNHTPRCHHASGSPEEYIERAISCGIKYIGFSEHFPLVQPDGTQVSYRLKAEEVKDYFDEINLLKEKYKDKIDIKTGFEMEYYSDLFSLMYKNAADYGAEYLILGQHSHLSEMNENIWYASSRTGTDDKELLTAHTDSVVEAIQKEAFTYVAHPDIFHFIGDEDFLRKQWTRIAVASREHNIPLEINFLGIREKRAYPSDLFWEIAGTEQASVTFGFDAHDVMAAFDQDSLLIAKKMVEKYNLNYIGKPILKPLK